MFSQHSKCSHLSGLVEIKLMQFFNLLGDIWLAAEDYFDLLKDSS